MKIFIIESDNKKAKEYITNLTKQWNQYKMSIETKLELEFIHMAVKSDNSSRINKDHIEFDNSILEVIDQNVSKQDGILLNSSLTNLIENKYHMVWHVFANNDNLSQKICNIYITKFPIYLIVNSQISYDWILENNLTEQCITAQSLITNEDPNSFYKLFEYFLIGNQMQKEQVKNKVLEYADQQ